MRTHAIYYLSHSQIDEEKWNACIDGASNGLIYAYSFYLNAMAGQWDALVLGNYEAVMPLPWRKKFGIYYLYQPFLTAQLGLFGNNLSAALLQAFLHAIPKKFRLWEFPLNHQNLFPVQPFRLYCRTNFVLGLNKPYPELYTQFRQNTRRNIRKAQNLQCVVKTQIPLTEIIALNRQHFAAAPYSDADYRNFESLHAQLRAKGKAITYGVFQNEHLLASCCFLFSHKRAYYLLVGNHPNGRTLGASHLLVDAFIQDHAAQNLMLDFEGSDLRNLAFFYSSFGAVEEPYAAIQYNRLPWFIKMLKK